MGKIQSVFCILFITFSITAHAQNSELVLMVGSSHFLGDLGGKNGIGTNEVTDLDINTIRYALGMGLRLKVSEGFALRINGIYTRAAGDDANTQREVRRDRGLSF